MQLRRAIGVVQLSNVRDGCANMDVVERSTVLLANNVELLDADRGFDMHRDIFGRAFAEP